VIINEEISGKREQGSNYRDSNHELGYLFRLTVGFTTVIDETSQVAFAASINNLQK